MLNFFAAIVCNMELPGMSEDGFIYSMSSATLSVCVDMGSSLLLYDFFLRIPLIIFCTFLISHVEMTSFSLFLSYATPPYRVPLCPLPLSLPTLPFSPRFTAPLFPFRKERATQ